MTDRAQRGTSVSGSADRAQRGTSVSDVTVPSGGAADLLSWRAPVPDDADAWAALLAVVEAADHVGEIADAEELAAEFGLEWADPRRDARFGWAPDRTLAAFGWAQCDPGARGDLRVLLWGEVAPAWRRRGVGTALFEWLEPQGAATARLVDPARPAGLEVWVDAANEERTAFARARGYQPLRSFVTMTRVLAGEDGLPAVGTPPDGMEGVPWTPGLDDAVRLAHTEAFADHWGSPVLGPTDWRLRISGAPSFRPAWSRVVVDGGEVAAYQLAHEWPAEAALKGWTEAWIGQLGTRRAWRGRGLATLLMADALRSFAAAGRDRAALDVDTANPTGALGLYERLGFTTWRTMVAHARAVPTTPV